MGVCTITVVGHLGRDPESREVGGTTVTSFSIAHNRKVKGEDHTDWFNVDAWGKLGELCERYLAKGRVVAVSGQLQPREYEKDGNTRMALDIRAADIHFMGGATQQQDTPEGAVSDDDDDDIPF